MMYGTICLVLVCVIAIQNPIEQKDKKGALRSFRFPGNDVILSFLHLRIANYLGRKSQGALYLL